MGEEITKEPWFGGMGMSSTFIMIPHQKRILRCNVVHLNDFDKHLAKFTNKISRTPHLLDFYRVRRASPSLRDGETPV